MQGNRQAEMVARREKKKEEERRLEEEHEEVMRNALRKGRKRCRKISWTKNILKTTADLTKKRMNGIRYFMELRIKELKIGVRCSEREFRIHEKVFLNLENPSR